MARYGDMFATNTQIKTFQFLLGHVVHAWKGLDLSIYPYI